ncbi:hypothetical protein B0O99DRAFT_517575 [Bisporella sp. PMI_857]|nr:hypothetical protein B0O99DRAFT_517575 [Bisporella sp. PMI_857]
MNVEAILVETIEGDAENAKPTETRTTLYPKTSGKSKDFIQSLSYRGDKYQKLLTNELELIGTVKLHGTHTDIVVNHDDSIRLQSRNTENITLQNDMFEWARSMLPLREQILRLKRLSIAAYRQLNPQTEISREMPLILAGEWIGPGIQKKVAINNLSRKAFVIFGLCINGKWQPTEPYKDIHDEASGIYNICRGGIFRHKLPLDDIAASLESLQPLADAVEKECPFAKSFGVSGMGEGIVWKPTNELCEDSRFWLKMKGPIFTGPTISNRMKNISLLDQKEKAKLFAESVTNEMRLEQAWAYLDEMKIPRDKKAISAYLKWLTNDVAQEEKTEIDERQIDKTILSREVTKIGRAWYLQRSLQDTQQEV